MTTGEVPEMPATNMNALVDALDRRARQAGSEGATTVIRGMLTSITEVLGGLEGRLARIEESLETRAQQVETRNVETSLATLHDRLSRLEEAFVQAVETSTEGTDSMIADIQAAVTEAFAAMVPEPSPSDEPSAMAIASETALAELTERLAAIDARLAAAAATPPDVPTPVLPDVMPAIANVADVVRGIEANLTRAVAAIDLGGIEDRISALATELTVLRSRFEGWSPGDERSADAIVAFRQEWEAAHDRLDRMVGALRAALDERPDTTDAAAILKEVFALQDAVRGLGRGDQSAQLVSLVESRLSAAVDAVVRRSESSLEGVQRLRADVEALTGAVESLGTRLEQSSAGVLERLLAVADHQSTELTTIGDAIRSELTSLLKDLSASGTDGNATEKVVEAVRREAELLTQRVASLTKTIEGIRAELDEHSRRTENTIGRKAGEMGRRLAADFGIRTARRPEDNDPRQLPPRT